MKSRNQLKLVVALVMAACAGIASAEQFQDNAQVTGSQPIFAQGNCCLLYTSPSPRDS